MAGQLGAGCRLGADLAGRRHWASNGRHLQRFHPAQEPAQIQEVGEGLPVLFAGHPGLFPLRRVDSWVVPDQGVGRRRPAAPRRADHRVAHLLHESARDTQTRRQCAPLSTQPRLRTLSRGLATCTGSACHLAVTERTRPRVTWNATNERVPCPALGFGGRGLTSAMVSTEAR